MEFSDDFLNILFLLKLEKLLRRRNQIKAELKYEIDILANEEHIIPVVPDIHITQYQYEDENNSKKESTNKILKKRKINTKDRVFNKNDLMPKKKFLKRYDPNDDDKPIYRNRKNEMCDLCGIILRRSNLEFHMNTHYNKKPFVCDIENCNQAFSAPSTLFRHKKLHTANKQFTCDICSAKFHFNGNLQKHKIIHNEPTFKCMECGNMFKSSTRLKHHKKLLHGEFQNIDCTISSCNKKFANSHVLRKHLRIFHNIKVRFRVPRPEM